MKKYITAFIAAMLLSAPCANAMRGEEIQIHVIVGGQEIKFEDQKPIIIAGRTLLPIRGVMEAMGKTVSWNNDERCAVITDGRTTISLGIGNNIMKKTITNGFGVISSETELDTAPIILNDRTCLPVRAAAEAFGAEVRWDDASKTVFIDGGQ
ncbi:MAG: copper amine oxidase N-terminal domain-containing protein [bacterium]|nr:copper amine oxidase N-terminal domain-containing protein [bacterium]